jgi:hypothetical protein
MLSHPASPEESAVAADSLAEPATRENRRRPITVEDILSHFDGEFFCNWFINGPKLLLKGKFSRRAAVFLAIGAMPALLGAAYVILPDILFPTPEHNAFFQFARTVSSDVASLIPLGIGVVASLFSFRLPLGS